MGSISASSSLLLKTRFQPPVRWTIALILCLCPIGSVHAETATVAARTVEARSVEAQSVAARSVAESPPALNQPVTPVAVLTDWQSAALENQERLNVSAPADFVVAGADNFNPGLQLPPPKPEPFNPSSSTGDPTVVGLEQLQTDYRNDRDNFGQHNRSIEQTAPFRLQNGDRLRFKTGFNTFEQRKMESVRNVPLQAGWEHKLGNFNINLAVGVDVFDRLPTSPNVDLEIAAPILPSVTLTAVVEQGAYKSNAQTLENRISAFHYGANLYWQIDKNTSFFALYRRGNYSDDNREQQSFSHLERKFGQFSIAANLFTWSFDQNAEARKGYFSPSDFLVYSGEVAWQGDIFEFLRCRLAATLGRQRLNGAFSGGNTYQALCTVKLAPNIEADLGYTYSNVQNRSGGGNAYENQSVIGQLRVTF